MATTTMIPVTVTSEAEAFITEVGQRCEFEAMLEHTKQTIPGLRTIEVKLDDTPETGPPGVVLYAHRDSPGPEDDRAERRWWQWQIVAFPPEVCQNFILLTIDSTDGR